MSIILPAFQGGINLAQPVNFAHPLNKGLVSWWLALPGFGRKAFTWYDLCRRHNGVLTNMDPATDWVGARGRPGGFGSLDFDGSNDFVDLGSGLPSSFTSITMSFWGRTPATQNSMAISLGSAADAYMFLLGTTFRVRFVDLTSDTTDVASAVVADAWQYYSVSWDGATVRCFVNGVERASEASTGTISVGSGRFIGAFAGGGLNFLGQMDDVRVYTRALAASEHQAYYDLSRRFYPGLLNRVQRYWLVSAEVASHPVDLITQHRYGLTGQRYGSFAGKTSSAESSSEGQIIEETLTLGVSTTLSASAVATMQETLTLATVAGMSPANIATMQESLTLAAQMDLAVQATAIAQEAITLAVQLEQDLATTQTIIERVTLAVEAAITARGGQTFQESLTFAVAVALQLAVEQSVAPDIIKFVLENISRGKFTSESLGRARFKDESIER